MVWQFHYQHIPSQNSFNLEYPDGAAAHAAMRDFIATLRPPHSLISLQTECENFPNDKAASITDGEHYFSVCEHG